MGLRTMKRTLGAWTATNNRKTGDEPDLDLTAPLCVYSPLYIPSCLSILKPLSTLAEDRSRLVVKGRRSTTLSTTTTRRSRRRGNLHLVLKPSQNNMGILFCSRRAAFKCHDGSPSIIAVRIQRVLHATRFMPN